MRQKKRKSTKREMYEGHKKVEIRKKNWGKFCQASVMKKGGGG